MEHTVLRDATLDAPAQADGAPPSLPQLLLWALAGHLMLYGALAAGLGLLGLGAWAALAPQAPVGGTVGLALAAVGLLLLAAVARAAALPLPGPQGIELKRGDALDLYRLIDKIRGKLRAPALDRVIVTGHFAVGITQRPRLGLFGGNETTLVIGLPYLLATDLRGFAASLGREYAHLAGRYGALDAWLYRLRRHWRRLLEPLEARAGWAGWLLRPLALVMQRYVRLSLAHARQQELAADRVAAQLFGADAVAQDALIAAVTSAWLKEAFWPEIYQDARTHLAPPRPPYAQLSLDAPDALAHPQAREWLARALGRHADHGHTQPSLRQRLSALERRPRVPLAPRHSAMDHVLRDLQRELVDTLDRRWTHTVRAQWQAQYQQSHAQREERERLRSLATRPGVDLGVLRQLAALEEALGDLAQASAVWERICAAAANDARAHLNVGRLLLAQGEPRGVSWLQHGVALDPALSADAEAELADWHERQARMVARAKRAAAQSPWYKPAPPTTLSVAAPAEPGGWSLEPMRPGPG